MKTEEGKERTLKNHLIERIKESGYPLEIEMSNILDPDYIVFNTSRYFDADAQQDRDIDIYAIPMENTRVFTDEELEKRWNHFTCELKLQSNVREAQHIAGFFSLVRFLNQVIFIHQVNILTNSLRLL